MDSASIFDGLSVGADTAITGMATLIAVTEVLHQVKSDIEASLKNVDNIFMALFNGESFDYIGSSRMVYDMLGNKFPRPLNDDNPLQGPLVSLEHIKYWIELGSLAAHNDSTVYLHSDPISSTNTSVDKQVT